MKRLLLFIPLFLFSYQVNLAEMLTKPKSYVRDFYLTEFMRETNQSDLAYKAYYSLYKPKMKHLKILSKKFDFFKPIYRCVNPSPKDIRNIDIACVLNNGLWLSSMARLGAEDLIYLYSKLPDGREKKAVWAFLNKDFSNVFKSASLGYYFILRYPSKRIDQKITNFRPFYGKYFHLFVKSAAKHDLPLIQKSINRLNYKYFSDKTKWWMFLIAMKLKDEKRAQNILKSMKKTSKVNFWLWQLTGDKKYLNELLKSNRVNFYTLYAYEEAHKNFKIYNKILFNTVKKPKYDQTNPWDVLKFWDEFRRRKDLFKFAKELDSPKSEALKALVLDKAHNYVRNYFITPKMYEDKDKRFKAFVYAIARQESRFIPASVSSSYALGTMQIMPFLVRDMKGDVFNQFDYDENIRLGAKHLRWLFKRLDNPLMVAYAYNGGIGFVKRRVLPKFRYKGKYEPFLSMENVVYDESREYGKKVIANYVIYSKLFGKPVTLHELLGKKIPPKEKKVNEKKVKK